MAASYPRRQQIRRLRRAGGRGLQAIVALTCVLLLAWAGERGLASLAVLLAAVLAFRRCAHAAPGAAEPGRRGVRGRFVPSALEPLKRHGWRVRHSLDWPGPGDLDHVVRAPWGEAFVIETKTLRYTRAQLLLAGDAARWLARRRRRYPHGVRPVICLARRHRIDEFENGVIVVSADRILPALHREAGVPSR